MRCRRSDSPNHRNAANWGSNVTAPANQISCLALPACLFDDAATQTAAQKPAGFGAEVLFKISLYTRLAAVRAVSAHQPLCGDKRRASHSPRWASSKSAPVGPFIGGRGLRNQMRTTHRRRKAVFFRSKISLPDRPVQRPVVVIR